MNLKQQRRQAGLTLAQLSERAALSKGYLSKLERGLATPTIAVALRLSRALAVSLAELYPELGEAAPGTDGTTLQRRDATPLLLPQNGAGYRALAGAQAGRRMQPLLVYPPAELGAAATLHQHAGEEFFYVLHGTVALHFADETITLGAGDSLYFDARRAHRTQSVGDEPAEALVVIAG
ncbi:XRE family transcriptional regulator [Crenobacter sp. SG2305]|uniref:helix-turn-helix domain-containing protein n=1 Tax=Crenobacter oryzisoli TaxID=3056844 RepID=UPI0025AB0E6C|nr:XRE family transcriptional regulator [Crenobacter sp. SG2305]MDN0083561.1 XRE family transcriptional regulator [Crenobacter sp. SG2305]